MTFRRARTLTVILLVLGVAACGAGSVAGDRGAGDRSAGDRSAGAGSGAARTPEGDAAPTAGPADDVPGRDELVAAAAMAPCPDVASEAPPVEGGLPDLVLPCLGEGPDVRLSALRGPAVVNAWASWCGPCRVEMPTLAAVAERAGGRVLFLGVDLPDDPVLALQAVVDTGVRYASVVADEAQGRALRAGLPTVPVGQPYTAFVDDAGRVVHVENRAVRAESELTALLDAHLGVAL